MKFFKEVISLLVILALIGTFALLSPFLVLPKARGAIAPDFSSQDFSLQLIPIQVVQTWILEQQSVSKDIEVQETLKNFSKKIQFKENTGLEGFIYNPFGAVGMYVLANGQQRYTCYFLAGSNQQSGWLSDQYYAHPNGLFSFNTALTPALKQHFEAHKIKPSVQINNTEGNQTDIQLANHKIKWFDKDDETKIKIDNDLFTLKDKVTLNNVNYGKDSVDFSNNWDEIKLFKHNDREYIGIRMSFAPCVGLGCSVDFFLIYDVKTKTKNFFGTFRTDRELELFNYGNDDKIDFVAKTHNGSANGSTPIEYIYELYSMDTNGQFKVQKDSSGLTYQIKHTFFPNDTTKTDKLTEHWITKIK